MKKVTTNITFGQILFILLTVLFACLMFFYLGAKFGPKILNMGELVSTIDDPLLPDEKLANEIKELLATQNHDFIFHKVLQSQLPPKSLEPKLDNQKTFDVKDLVTQEQLKEIKDNQISKDDSQKSKVESQKPIVKQITQKNTKPISEPTKVEVKKVDDIQVKTANPIVINNPTTEDIKEIKPAYRLQLGSYSEKKKADSASLQWQERGYSVQVVKAKINGKGYWYRLQLGAYADMDEVLSAQKTIMSQYRQSSRIVKVE